MACKGCKDKSKEILKTEFRSTSKIIVGVIIMWLLIGLYGFFNLIKNIF